MNLPDINRPILFKTVDGVLSGFFLGTVFSGQSTPMQNVPYDTDEVTGWVYINDAYDAYVLERIRTNPDLQTPTMYL